MWSCSSKREDIELVIINDTEYPIAYISLYTPEDTVYRLTGDDNRPFDVLMPEDTVRCVVRGYGVWKIGQIVGNGYSCRCEKMIWENDIYLYSFKYDL